MDELLPALVGVLPELGAGGVLAVVLWLALRSQGQDRADHRTQLADERAVVKALRAENELLEQKLDAERERRRKAEDVAARSRHPRGRT